MVRYRGKLTCCDHVHVRPCGLVPGNEVAQESICACGCSGYDERCGGSEWWLGGTHTVSPPWVSTWGVTFGLP